jgi:hypothetical protein
MLYKCEKFEQTSARKCVTDCVKVKIAGAVTRAASTHHFVVANQTCKNETPTKSHHVESKNTINVSRMKG